MNEQQHPNPDDLLDRAVAAFVNQQIPGGLSPRTVNDTLAILRAAAGQRLPLWQRIIVMIQTHKMAASVAAAVSAAGIILAVVLFGSFPSITYAQVAEQLRGIQSMTCVVTARAGSRTVSIKEMFMSPGRIRMEMSKGGTIVTDSLARKSMILDPRKRTAMIIEVAAAKAPTSQPAGAGTDMIEYFRNLANDKTVPVADRQIGAIKAKGFRTKDHGVDVTIYVHPKTSLPVELDFEQFMGLPIVKFTDFDFEAKLDPSLFSIEVPAGYTAELSKVEAPSGDLAENLVPVFRAYGQQTGGQFPPNLDDTMGVMHTALGKRTNTTNEADPAVRKLITNIFALRALLGQYHKGKDFDYLPEGAKVGDAGKIILWYQPKGATTYKAIYADLHVAEVTADQLPKPPGTDGL